MMRYTEDEATRDASLKALMSGGVSGAIFGLGAKMLGSKSPTKALDLMKAAAMGASISGPIAGGSTYLGSKVMGPPGDDEPSGYTRRATLGGALSGGALGAGLGALAAKGRIPIPKATPHFISEYVKKLAGMPGSKPMQIGAGVGALLGGTAAGSMGANEGMQLDLINNELREVKRKRMREMYGQL